MKTLLLLIRCTCVVAGPLLFLAAAAQAQPSEDRKFLLLYFKEEELVVESPTRGPKSVTQVAENITVITAEDIRLINAHTVADVLNSVTGVQMFITGGPGSSAMAFIQGSEYRHVAVFIDGIPLNNLSDNVADVGILPVQNIEKIELIKGPASSAWGSALGGVINIITKSNGDQTRGVVSASYGKRDTGDFRIETSGKLDRLGYYVTAGRLQTDGFRPHSEFEGNNGYVKLAYDLTNSTRVALSAGYDKLERGMFEIPSFIFQNNDAHATKSVVSLSSAVNKNTDLSISLWSVRQKHKFVNYLVSTGTPTSSSSYTDSGYGANAKLTWKDGRHYVVIGGDFDSRKLESNAIAGGEQGLMKSAYYINDTISFARLSLIPGVRYDKTDSNGDFTSPSIGATYRITDNTLLRAYTARGFSVPPLAYTYGDTSSHVANPNLVMERVKSYQAGIETAALQHIWVKIDAFRHDIDNGLSPQSTTPPVMMVNEDEQRRQGLEIEIKTTPVYHISFIAGASFLNAEARGIKIQDTPQRTYDLGLQYDDDSLKILLTGHAIDWNTNSLAGGNYDGMLFDINAVKNITTTNNQGIEAFINIRNVLNEKQYRMDLLKNPERWFEAGIRYVY